MYEFSLREYTLTTTAARFGQPTERSITGSIDTLVDNCQSDCNDIRRLRDTYIAILALIALSAMAQVLAVLLGLLPCFLNSRQRTFALRFTGGIVSLLNLVIVLPMWGVTYHLFMWNEFESHHEVQSTFSVKRFPTVPGGLILFAGASVLSIVAYLIAQRGIKGFLRLKKALTDLGGSTVRASNVSRTPVGLYRTGPSDVGGVHLPPMAFQPSFHHQSSSVIFSEPQPLGRQLSMPVIVTGVSTPMAQSMVQPGTIVVGTPVHCPPLPTFDSLSTPHAHANANAFVPHLDSSLEIVEESPEQSSASCVDKNDSSH